MNEQTVLHRIYRECVDSVNDIWRRVSFWTQAVDVDLRQGETVQYRLDNLDLDSTKSKTLIEEYIEEAAEQHRLLTAQLDRLEDEIVARMPGLGMLSDTYKIIADANPEAATLYESRLAEAREEIAAMIKPVEDELERLRGLLSSAISNVEEDPLSDDILQKIQALRTKTDNDVADVNTNYIGEGFDPGVKAIGNSLTEAILNQEFNIHSVGAKFWEFYGFLGDEVVSSEDLYELETVDGMNVLDFLSGSYVNIDYNRKLNLCYIRGWVKIPFSDCYYRASGSHSSVFGAKYNIVLGTIGLIDIFPKMDGNSNQINLNTGIRYACIEYSNGFIYKINSYLGQGHPTYTNITNYSDDPYSSVYGSWNHCKVIIPFLWDTDVAQTFYDSTSSTFGDEGEGSDTSTPEYVWVYFEDGYFDNAYVQPVEHTFAPDEKMIHSFINPIFGFGNVHFMYKPDTIEQISIQGRMQTDQSQELRTFYPSLFVMYVGENDFDPPTSGANEVFFNLVFNKGMQDELKIPYYFSFGSTTNPSTYATTITHPLLHSGAIFPPSTTSKKQYGYCINISGTFFGNPGYSENYYLTAPTGSFDGKGQPVIYNNNTWTLGYLDSRPWYEADAESSIVPDMFISSSVTSVLENSETTPKFYNQSGTMTSNYQTVTVEWTNHEAYPSEDFIVALSYNIINKNETVGGNNLPKIVTFADGTDEELKAMLDAHYDENIDFDIHDHWNVGDKRTITINQIRNTSGNTVINASQEITVVLVNAGGLMINDEARTGRYGAECECAFVWHLENCLAEPFYMALSYDGANRWTTLNNGLYDYTVNCFKQEGLAGNGFAKLLKEHRYYTGVGNGSSNVEQTNYPQYIFLPTESQICGTSHYSAPKESELYPQWSYYKNQPRERVVKKLGNNGNNTNYWLRSPMVTSKKEMCIMGLQGFTAVVSNSGYGGVSHGICPAGCI